MPKRRPTIAARLVGPAQRPTQFEFAINVHCKGHVMNDRPPPTPPDIQLVTFDAIMPAAMAVRAEEAGAARASIDPLTLLVLSVLAGAFVAFGAMAATTVSAGAGELP